MLAKIDNVFRQAKDCFDKPFGGITMILAGDFYQLAPVEG